jgi:hypothetical protein
MVANRTREMREEYEHIKFDFLGYSFQPWERRTGGESFSLVSCTGGVRKRGLWKRLNGHGKRKRRNSQAIPQGCARRTSLSRPRQTLEPEATGAAMEVTKWLKPSVRVSRIYGDGASVQAVTRVNAEQTSKRTLRRPTRQPYRGRLLRLGVSECSPAAAPGQWRQHVHKESARNTGSPRRSQG